jgi:hypothetical protein
LNTDYKLSDKNKIGVTYTAQITSGLDNNEHSTGTFSQSVTHKEDDKPIQMHNVLLDYSSGFGLKTGIEYTGYEDVTFQHFIENKEDKKNDFNANSKQNISRYRIFADQSHRIAAWMLTYGAQYLYAFCEPPVMLVPTFR